MAKMTTPRKGLTLLEFGIYLLITAILVAIVLPPLARRRAIRMETQRLQAIRIKSLVIEQATIQQVAECIEREAKVADPKHVGVRIKVDVARKDVSLITVKMSYVPLDQALRYMVESAGLFWRVEPDHVVISDK